jgi:signal transduction histidine kinase
MAHEIRNPLSAIKTFVQLLPRKIDTPGFLEKFNRTVPRETQRINLLVEELLELSRAPKYKFKFTVTLPLKETSLHCA